MSRFNLAQVSTFDINGNPRNGAMLEFFNVGLLTNKDTYSDEALATANANPVIADASGNFGNIWLNGDYDVTLKNSSGVLVWGPEKIESFTTSSTAGRLNPATVNFMVNDSSFSSSDVGIAAPTTAEFSTGNGGGGTYDIVLSTSVEPNGFNIIIGVADPLISFVLREESVEDPRRWGAVFDNATDIGVVLNAMLVAGVVPTIPDIPAVINTTVSILDNSTIVFLGSKLRTTVDTTVMFEANSRDDWALFGSAELRGTLVASGASAETGLRVLGGHRFKIENITSRLFQGKGFDFDNDGTATKKGQKGQLNNCAAYECTIGWEFNDGQSAEYQVLTGCSAAGCVEGIRVQAGNLTWTGGNVTDNGTGITLITGANSNHGTFTGLNINHNDISLSAADVVLGYTFSDCHWYGDSSSLGKILITNSKGIDINGGQLDASVEIQSGGATLNGLNILRNMQIVGSNFNLAGNDLVNLRSYSHYNFNGQAIAAYLSVQPTLVSGGVGFVNSWADFGASRNSAGFYLSETGNVHLQGMVASGTVNLTMFTLPLGYRPDNAIELIVNSNGAAGFLFIDTGGNVSLTAGSNAKVSLDGVTFRAKT